MGEIRPLTSLRGIAAFAVVLQHFSETAQSLTPHWIPSLVPHGYMAVGFFFVLSGFIMCLTYLPAFAARGLKAFPDFLVRRIARIVPLNTFVLFALLVAGVISQRLAGANWIFDGATIGFDLPANLLMLQGLGVGRNLNPPSWSISTEFAAYLLFPVFVALVFSRRRYVPFLALCVAVTILCSVALRHPRLGLGTDDVGDQVLLCFTEFVIGMGSFALYRYRAASNRDASDLEIGLLFAACAVGLLAGVDLFVALLFPFVIVASALNRGVVARFLSSGVPYFLGLISFSIYLVHSPFRGPELWLFHALHPEPVSAFMALAFAFAGSLTVVPVAWITYIVIERPGRRIVRYWANAESNLAVHNATGR